MVAPLKRSADSVTLLLRQLVSSDQGADPCVECPKSGRGGERDRKVEAGAEERYAGSPAIPQDVENAPRCVTNVREYRVDKRAQNHDCRFLEVITRLHGRRTGKKNQ